MARDDPYRCDEEQEGIVNIQPTAEALNEKKWDAG
jgi:hypothetical protein